jgi:predicted Zn-dependent peptidase
MNIISIPGLPFSIVKNKLSNGMNVLMIPRNEFRTIQAKLHVNFGQKNESSYIVFNGKKRNLPQGTAHFLEHRIFESNGEHLSSYFAKFGASINASTGSDSTTYYFNTVREFPQLIRYFLNFIQSYQDTEEGVKKEASIIKRELVRRYESQQSQIQKKMMDIVFPNHHLSKEILGTEESINSIKLGDLIFAFKHYYRPDNMTLIISGRIDINSTMALLEDIQSAFPNAEGNKEEKVFELTSIQSREFFHQFNFNISAEENHFIIKFNPSNQVDGPEFNQRKMIILDIIRRLLLSSNSPFYIGLKNQGLLESSLQGSLYYVLDSYTGFFYEAHTKKPKELFEALKVLFKQKWDDSIMVESFEGIKKALLGGSLRSLNNLSSVASIALDNFLDDVPFFNRPRILKDITFEEVKRLCSEIVETELHFFCFFPNNKN